MEQDMEYRQKLLQEYKQTILPFLRYLPWFEQNRGQSASTLYHGEGDAENALSFPVYDATLLNFVREISKSKLMDRNYRYVYTRKSITSHNDERKRIESAGLREWDILCGILSKYVLGGQTKCNLWSEAVREDIFYLVIKKMKEIVEYWDSPLDSKTE